MSAPGISSHPTRWLRDQMTSGRRGLAISIVLGSLATLCAVGLVGTSGWLISTAAQQPPVLTLTVAAVLVRTLAVGRGVLRYAERLTGHDAALRGLVSLRVSVYRQLERLAPAGLAAFRRGDLLNRLAFDVDAALDLPLRVLLPWAQAIVVATATSAFLWWLNPGVGALVGACSVVAIAGLPVLASRRAAQSAARIAPAQAALSTVVVGSLQSAADIATFGASDRVCDYACEVDASLTRESRDSAHSLGLTSGLVVGLQGMAVCGVLAEAIPAVTGGTMGPVWLAVAAFLPLALFDVLATLPTAALSWRRLTGSAGRLAELTELPAPGPVDGARSGWCAPAGAITVDGLSAGWPGLPVLTGVSFRVKAGERLWVVGPSGVGKSTLAAVLVGFCDYAGSVRIDGREIRDLSATDVRSSVGLFAQSGHLFDTTIRENVLLGRQREEEDVRQALDRVGLTGWLDTLDDGLDTQVGPEGSAVSGGQARRIELARLLVDPRRIVILDEPTEHLDTDTATELQFTLDTVLADATRIVITHRFTGICSDDPVLLIERRGNGTVEGDSGTAITVGPAGEVAERSEWFAAERTRQREEERLLAWARSLPIGVAQRW